VRAVAYKILCRSTPNGSFSGLQGYDDGKLHG
jgi:hypothetical protein